MTKSDEENIIAHVIGGEVNATIRREIPPSNETILDDLNIDELMKILKGVKIYFRDKESCPFKRGNWVIDFFFQDNTPLPDYCMKLPAEMKKEEVERWVKPLLDKFKNRHH